MDTKKLLQEVAAKDVDIKRFAKLAIRDAQIRDELVGQMRTHPHIMVYYHCFYAVDKASRERPDLFYQYWEDIASLLDHANSYHRDFALTILANLTQVDHADLFSGIFEDYFAHLDDDKFMTSQCCVQNSLKILRNKPEWRAPIISLLLTIGSRSRYPEKQLELLKCDVVAVLDEIYEEIEANEKVIAFIKAGETSISPKMRRTAKQVVAKYGL